MKPYLKDEDGIIHINPFICPECGSKDDTYSAYQSLIDTVKLKILGSQNLNLLTV